MTFRWDGNAFGKICVDFCRDVPYPGQMLYKSSRHGFTSARALLLLTFGAACSSACVSEVAPTPTPPPEPVSASRPPPPISGGTLLVTKDNSTIVAADPDRDRVLIADIASRSLSGEIQFDLGDEPGRVVEGAPGRAYVALRRAGEVVAIDLAQKNIVSQTAVCPAPRGMAHVNGQLHVACAGGELVTLDTATNTVVRSLKPGDDLRDIVVQGSDLLVTQFRSAQVLRIDANGTVTEVQTMIPGGPFSFGMEAAVAWRMVSLPTGGVGVVHQSASINPVMDDQEGGYGEPGPCGGDDGIVKSFVSFGNGASGVPMKSGTSIRRSALPVDIAFSNDGKRMAVVSAGSNKVVEKDTAAYSATADSGDCEPDDDDDDFQHGQPIAVAFADSTRIVQTREPARIIVGQGDIIELGGESMVDTGHEMFHKAASARTGLACASCHPEGREDGRVWQFASTGARRTQSIAGGILATAPFHWNGDLNGFDALMTNVFTKRMSGPELAPIERLAAARWIDAIPQVAVSPVEDPVAVAHGKTLFEDAAVGCAGCHSGVRLTNNQSVDVGTFGVMQVPSLNGLASRAPYMHDGCAKTLEDRFTNTACGGGDLHGHTSQLSAADVADLVAYLKTL